MSLLYVDVVGTPSHPLDQDLVGQYLFKVEDHLPQGMQACAVLDAFHESIPVKVLDDFSFGVYTQDGVALEDNEPSTYTMGHHATFLGKWKTVFLGKSAPFEP